MFKRITILILVLVVSVSFISTPAVSLARDITFPELVELLISIGAITGEKAVQARNIARIYNSSAPQSGSAVSGSVISQNFSFNKDLFVGMDDSDVFVLQKVLNSNIETKIALSGTGSPSNETTYFGGKTEAAVIKFQQKYNIEPSLGYVGQKTRLVLNSILPSIIGSISSSSVPLTGASANTTPVNLGNQAGAVNFQSGNQNSATGQWNNQTGTWGNNTLTVSCSASPSNTQINNLVTWTAVVSGYTSGDNGGYTYSWSGTDSLSGSGSSVSKVYTLSGSKSATVTVVSGGLRISANCSVSVNPAATGNLYSSCFANPSYAQVGNNINWSANVLGTAGTPTYSWSGTDGLSGSGSSISKIYSSSGNKTANLVVTSGEQTSTATCNAALLATTSPIIVGNSSSTPTEGSVIFGTGTATTTLATTTATSTATTTATANTSTAEATTVFGGVITYAYVCPGQSELTVKLSIEGASPFTGWSVYYRESELATTTSEDGTTEPYSALGGMILGTASNSDKPTGCDNVVYSYGANPAGELLWYDELGYIREFGSDPDYGANE